MKRLTQDELDYKKALIESAQKQCNGINVKQFQNCNAKIDDAIQLLRRAKKVGQ